MPATTVLCAVGKAGDADQALATLLGSLPQRWPGNRRALKVYREVPVEHTLLGRRPDEGPLLAYREGQLAGWAGCCVPGCCRAVSLCTGAVKWPHCTSRTGSEGWAPVMAPLPTLAAAPLWLSDGCCSEKRPSKLAP